MTTPAWKIAARSAKRILAAVSGGADSVLLLHHLLEFARTEGLEVAIAHINHATRGDESEGDHRFVSQLALDAGLPFFERRVAAAAEGGHRNEWELREGRLGLLREMAAEAQCPAIALGHHRDDVAETFLLMALRGSGPGGLGSMTEVARWPGGLTAIRPLISLSRGEILGELRRRGIPWRDDSSNASEAYRRNFLRAKVLPLLEEIEPGARRLLARSAHLCAGEHAVHEQACRDALAGAVAARGEGAQLLHLSALRALPAPVCAGVIRLAAAAALDGHLPPSATPRHPRGTRLDGAVARIIAGGGDAATFDLENGALLWAGSGLALLHRDHLPLGDAFARVRSGLAFILLDDDRPTPLPVADGETRIIGGGRFTLRVGAKLPPPRPPWEAAIPRSAAGEELLIRAAGRTGQIALPGGRGHKSAAASLKDAAVPPPLRGRVAALYSGNKLLWIPGIRQSADTLLADGGEGVWIRVEIA